MSLESQLLNSGLISKNTAKKIKKEKYQKVKNSLKSEKKSIEPNHQYTEKKQQQQQKDKKLNAEKEKIKQQKY